MNNENTKFKEIKKMQDYIVIGLGRFGQCVATTLYSLGKNVLAIDTKQENVKAVDKKVSSIVVADGSSYEALHSLGAQNFDCAIICIGNNIESSILTAQICKELNIGYIIAKAQNEQHGKILTSIGVDLVVYPEEYLGKKLATALTRPTVNEIMDLTEEFKLYEIKAPEPWYNKEIGELNIRNKYKLSVVIIKRENKVLAPDSETVILENDTLILAGEKSKINALANITFTNANIVGVLNEMFL